MKTTIYINGRFLTQKITGVQRVALELTKAIDNHLDQEPALLEKFSFQIIHPKPAVTSYKFKHIGVLAKGLFKGHLWEQVELPIIARGGLLINFCNVAPLVKRNQIVMIHDTAVFVYPEAYSLLFRVWYKINYTVASACTRKILTVSEFSKSELIKYLGLAKEKIDVIYPASAFIGSKARAAGTDIASKYILAVGSLNPQKNLLGVLNAFKELNDLNLQLLIVGGKNESVFKSISFPADVGEKVKFLGYVSDEELIKLYSEALCFVFPSFYEGFGLPPLEAMSCGCPVIVSNRASLPEICGDAAILCNPFDARQIANSVRLLYSDEHERQEYILRGYERLKKFGFDQSALKLLKSISDIAQ